MNKDFEELFNKEELEYLDGWVAYFNEFIINYDVIDEELNNLIDLLYEFKEDYKHSIQMPESINYHQIVNDAKEIEDAQDTLEDLIKETDNLYIGFEMEQLLVNWEPEEFAERVKDERPEFGDKLLNSHELSDLALQYIEQSMVGYPDHYSLCDLKEKLEDCGLNGEKLLNL